MKTKTNNKNAKLSPLKRFKKYYKEHPKNRKYIIIGIILSVGLIYWIGAITIEKIQFAKADKTLDSFVSDIKTNLGQPSLIKKDKSCIETGDKFQINGLPSCSISYYLEYPVTGADMANNYQNKIDPLIGKYFKITYQNINEFFEYQNSRDSKDTYYKLKNALLSCSYRVEYKKSKTTIDNIDNSKIIVYTGCYNSKSHWNHYKIR